MKNRSWLFWVIAISIVVLLINLVYMSFGEAPDVYTWTWFGWKFGFNWSSHPILKIILIIGGYITLHMLDEKQFEDELNK